MATVLPSSPDAESAILGAILIDETSMPGELRPDAFYSEGSALIYRAMVALRKRGEPIDCTTLGEQLGDEHLEHVGGHAHLSALMDGLPRPANTEEYSRIVTDKASLRGAIKSANSFIDSAMNGAADLDKHYETLSVHYRERLRTERIETPQWRTADDDITAAEDPDWIVDRYLAAGAATDLSGPPKSAGKTTLATHLSNAVIRGEPFLGAATKKGPVVYLTEETPTTFAQALRRAGLTGCTDLHILHKNAVIGMPWGDVMVLAVDKAKDVGAVLIVVDTSPTWMGFKGEEENQTGPVLEAMSHLRNAAAEGFAVLAIRHDRKSGGAVGTAGRGSSAYTGTSDIILGLRRPVTGTRPGVRELHALSRFDDTPDLLMIELTPEGYTTHGSASAIALEEAKIAIGYAAPGTPDEAKRLDELLDDIDINVSAPTLKRAVNELFREGVLDRKGNGVRGDPYQFFLIKHSSLSDQKEKGATQ